jgi:hypothetical protein
MSLFSSFIIPKLEAELIAQEPVIAEFLIKQAHTLATEVISWAESKMNLKPEVQDASS